MFSPGELNTNNSPSRPPYHKVFIWICISCFLASTILGITSILPSFLWMVVTSFCPVSEFCYNVWWSVMAFIIGMTVSYPSVFKEFQMELNLQQLFLFYWLDSWLYYKILKCCIFINKVSNMHFKAHRHHHRPSRQYILPKGKGKSF